MADGTAETLTDHCLPRPNRLLATGLMANAHRVTGPPANARAKVKARPRLSNGKWRGAVSSFIIDAETTCTPDLHWKPAAGASALGKLDSQVALPCSPYPPLTARLGWPREGLRVVIGRFTILPMDDRARSLLQRGVSPGVSPLPIHQEWTIIHPNHKTPLGHASTRANTSCRASNHHIAFHGLVHSPHSLTSASTDHGYQPCSSHVRRHLPPARRTSLADELLLLVNHGRLRSLSDQIQVALVNSRFSIS